MLARAVPKPGTLRGCPLARVGERCPTRGAAATPLRSPPIPSTPRPFNQLPGDWGAGWLNLYRFWQEGGLHNLHHIMAHKFQQFGPIYREKLGIYESVNIISPRDAATLFQAEGTLPERFSVPPWVAYRDYRNKPYGVLLKTGEAWRSDRLMLNKEVLSPQVVEGFVPLLSEVGEDFVRRARAQVGKSGRERWTADFTHELFRFALESVCHVLYGERLGLLQDFVDPEAQRFIDAVTLMFHTTSPMLYVPPALLRHLNAKTWRDHVWAWDAIFSQGERSACPHLPVSPKAPLRTWLHSAASSHQRGDLLLGPVTQRRATKARRVFHIWRLRDGAVGNHPGAMEGQVTGITLRGAALPKGLVASESFWHLGQPSCRVSSPWSNLTPYPPCPPATAGSCSRATATEEPPARGSDVLRCHIWRLPPPPRLWRKKVTLRLCVSSADKCIQNVYRDLRLQRKSTKEYMGILCSLIMQDKLPLDDIKASVTEMMAGGVDTTSMTLQWAMFELARSPGVQEQLRAEVLAAKREAAGDRVKMLKTIRLLKAAIKETLRLHPVAVTLQRYTTQEVILQDYRIPPKVSAATGSDLLRAGLWVEVGPGGGGGGGHGGSSRGGWIPALHPLFLHPEHRSFPADAGAGRSLRHGSGRRGLSQTGAVQPPALAGSRPQALQGVGVWVRTPPVPGTSDRRAGDAALPHAHPGELQDRNHESGGGRDQV
ncbi:cholesterol side-chain cleavage enzyme, mitochondrial isoform X3 [Balearica regulorum gibbericeps]|uniref:cholesterol side-chain cleavage enzyme, mitochondrial isoform X3 n=1 Tax=Balearica regulorum gibbericeps TaxID=100784 RepID=UPI003F62B0C1